MVKLTEIEPVCCEVFFLCMTSPENESCEAHSPYHRILIFLNVSFVA